VTRVPTTIPPQLSGADLLIDTNLLLLKVVGEFDPRLIKRKRLDQFEIRDLALLNLYISQAKNLITTHGILIETSNLASQLIDEPRRIRLFEKFASEIKKLDERSARAADACEHPAFLRYGLTDAVIAHVASNSIVVLTVDVKLWGYLHKKGAHAVNFNHCRSL
jgi:hypothetical protein